MSSIDGLALRKALGRSAWRPPRPFGPDGWLIDGPYGARVIVSVSTFEDGRDWIHASISRPDRLPTYADLVHLHRAIRGGAWYAHQLFVPPADHIDIHPHALHLWGLADATRALPDFGSGGSI